MHGALLPAILPLPRRWWSVLIVVCASTDVQRTRHLVYRINNVTVIRTRDYWWG